MAGKNPNVNVLLTNVHNTKPDIAWHATTMRSVTCWAARKYSHKPQQLARYIDEKCKVGQTRREHYKMGNCEPQHVNIRKLPESVGQHVWLGDISLGHGLTWLILPLVICLSER